MKRVYLLTLLLIPLLLLALWPVSTLTPNTEHHEGYTLIVYPFSEIDDVKVSPGGIIVRSGGNAYLLRNGGVKGYRVGSEKILGNAGDYLVTYLNYKVHLKRSNGIILNDKWSKSVKSDSSVAVGDDFVVTAEHDDRDLKVDILFYFPENGETRKYSFKSDRRGTAPRVVAAGEYAVVGVPYTWRLYYFKEGELLWEGSLPVECGYEEYPVFSLHIEENGAGYALSSEGKAFVYFDESGPRSVGINERYCLQFSGEEKNVTVISAVEVFDGCFAALVLYRGLEGGLYFYNASNVHYIENYTFKAGPAFDFVGSSRHFLALYRDHVSIFNCGGEVMRINGRYDGAYSLGEDFVLVSYKGNETLLYLPLANKTLKLGSFRVVGSHNGDIVGVRGSELVVLEMGSP
ncbi:hypothetical protein GQS_05750 [Thermococcus sp. 4557]|uniref:hypothetical protein n=1 Tax=Thermococcus sp. (strain CGMCC 1.5172 / 4557) TaxID=1042877 RepID=UPI000219EE69|nr:hypothetical protein [Thermococcus sp. 4557]AEK73050.1 hypothetical protein GQS_05750 [Thermococcus sp. 4557]